MMQQPLRQRGSTCQRRTAGTSPPCAGAQSTQQKRSTGKSRIFAQNPQQQGGQQAAQTVSTPEPWPRWPAAPAFLLAAGGGFAAVTADLFAPWGARWLLNVVDRPTHAWVVDHIPKLIRDLVFELGVSNVAITLGCVGWAVCTSVLLNDFADNLEGSKDVHSGEAAIAKEAVQPGSGSLGIRNVTRLASAWAIYWSAGGFLVPGDNLLVAWIKHACNRVRPSTRHKSFSFPSGHTTAVAFIVGMLLFALLPWVLELVDARSKEPNKDVKLGLLKNEGVRTLARKAVENGGKLWTTAVVSTAVGRVVGDVHWVTDTLAGGCLGAGLVSGFLILSSQLERRIGDRSSS